MRHFEASQYTPAFATDQTAMWAIFLELGIALMLLLILWRVWPKDKSTEKDDD